jgi:hypothetical protein
MEPQIWSEAEETFAYELTLREREIQRLKVSGDLLKFERYLKGVNVGRIGNPSHDKLAFAGALGGTAQRANPAGATLRRLVGSALAR